MTARTESAPPHSYLTSERVAPFCLVSLGLREVYVFRVLIV